MPTVAMHGADEILRGKSIAQVRESQSNCEKNLDLDDERGQSCGHSQFHSEKQQSELADPDGKTVGDHVLPRHLRASYEEYQRDGREKKSQGRKRKWRYLAQTQFDRDE